MNRNFKGRTGDPNVEIFLASSIMTPHAVRVDAVVSAARAGGADGVLIAVRLSLADNVAFFERRGFRYREPFDSGRHGLFVRELEPGR